MIANNLRGVADKSLARPGRKQATATKLGIYSTYSPRSSIHFLSRCSNFASHSKKNIRRLSVQPGLRGSNDLHIRRKMATFQFLISSFRPVLYVVWFLLGCKCPVSRGIVVQEQGPIGKLPAAFLLQNVLQLNQQRWVILGVDSLALWKISNGEDTVLIPKSRGENFARGFLHSDFLGRGETLCRHFIDCCFVSGS